MILHKEDNDIMILPACASYADQIDNFSFAKAGLGGAQGCVVGQDDVTSPQRLQKKRFFLGYRHVGEYLGKETSDKVSPRRDRDKFRPCPRR